MNDRFTVQYSRKPKHKPNHPVFRERADQSRANFFLRTQHERGQHVEVRRTPDLTLEIFNLVHFAEGFNVADNDSLGSDTYVPAHLGAVHLDESGDQFFEPIDVDGFGYVRVKARGFCVSTKTSFLMGRDGDDGDVFKFAFLPHQLCGRETVHTRQAQVHENDVGRLANSTGNGGVTVFGFKHDKALVLQRETHEMTRILDVLDQQHLEVSRIALCHGV